MKKNIFCLTIVFLLANSCGEEEVKNIYNSPVYFTVDMRNLDASLNAPMQAKAFPNNRLASDRVGFGGILAVCSASHIVGTIYNLYAYDLACPNERNPNVKVAPDNEGKAKCAKCGTVYDVFNGLGNVISGPSKSNLQVYRNVTHNDRNPGVFIISNNF